MEPIKERGILKYTKNQIQILENSGFIHYSKQEPIIRHQFSSVDGSAYLKCSKYGTCIIEIGDNRQPRIAFHSNHKFVDWSDTGWVMLELTFDTIKNILPVVDTILKFIWRFVSVTTRNNKLEELEKHNFLHKNILSIVRRIIREEIL